METKTNPFYPDEYGHYFVAPHGADGDYAYCKNCGVPLTHEMRKQECPKR